MYKFLLVLLLTGCATQKKADKFYKKHHDKLAELCADKFPVVEKFLPGDTVTNYDTLWGLEIHTDTLVSEPQVIVQTKTVNVPKIVTKTVTIHDTIIKENTAKIVNLQYDLVSSEVKLKAAIQRGDDYKSKYQNVISWLILCIVLLGMGIYLKLKKAI